jgi:hypothetical protein
VTQAHSLRALQFFLAPLVLPMDTWTAMVLRQFRGRVYLD